MTEKVLITRKEDIPVKQKTEHDPYAYKKYEVTPRGDFDQCYTAFYEIPPQKSNYPYHYHTQNTEVFYVISGNGILETPDGDRNIMAGDIIVCPPSEQSAHLIRNDSETETLTYLDFDTTHSPDIVHYPRSGKTGVIVHNQKSVFFRDNTQAGYYDGE